ncbi:cytochrome b/b6 domain-containing protein [Ferrovum sp. PN-J185]|uniref:cytochrome b n=1 Tax=Ferrovum sp. PN-J185 TaxID=1356306 RepID=UPI000834DD16|nr:cytochrome b/b6 domain-containing protein [Ferrovum sp. PN-J185]MCC6069120.1 cytochrome b/b6 domain-containing protein [Ferrovum sp. PN-J185]MDE1890899.1 cytochrome b/b6 domain-containing protein [Betaproteobacteria bacterium]MDE2055789.1 cytochrome b/b6 domain-containing protein [Betaproteobacteria bacterium]
MTRYPFFFQINHWITALLIASVLVMIEVRDLFDAASVRRELLTLHMELGVTVLFFISVRILQRLFFKISPPPEISIPYSKLLSHLVHVILYLLLVFAPLIGLLAKQMRGDDVLWFGTLLPVLISDDVGLPYAKTAKSIHEYLGNWLMYVALLHVGAAIIHQWFFKDNLISRMLPRFFNQGETNETNH